MHVRVSLVVAGIAVFGFVGPNLVDHLLLPRAPSPHDSSGQPQRWGGHDDDDETEASTEFIVHIEDNVLKDLQTRLDLWKPPGGNGQMQHTDSWSYGIDSTFMSKLVDHWRKSYDWRTYEAQLNSVGFKETIVDGLRIRFQEIVGRNAHKAILLLHGWPGSIWEFQSLMHKMKSNDVFKDYSIICPSLPGYGFSSAPTIEGYNVVAMAGTMHRLMKKLGYTRFIVQGGDWGSIVAQAMAYVDSSPILGLHLNFFPVPFSPGHFLWEAIQIRLFDDKESQGRAEQSRNLGKILSETGYLHQQATKPETLGYALSDSPVGLCAWIAEKFQSWSDPTLELEEKFRMDDILTNCMIYWTTNSITSSMRLYKEQFRTEEANALLNVKVDTPVALSLFPHEFLPPPDSSIKRKFTNIVLFSKHPAGGHFAALEHPELLIQDLVTFVQRL